jgi:hypothetical protein
MLHLRKQQGIDFENKIRYVLKLCNYQVLDEKDIVNKYGKHCSGIDHLIKVQDTIYFFQDKWTSSKITLSQINHFYSAIHFVMAQEQSICNISSIYVSKTDLTTVAIEAIEELQKLTKYNMTFTTINNMNEYYVIKSLINFLYNSQIFLFENDGSCLMNSDNFADEIYKML